MFKSTMLNALSNGLADAGCEFVANYPGTHSQDIFYALKGEHISANEKVAFERAYGASLGGIRSVVSMKNVGLNACADPYLHSILTGVNAGFVIVVTDDTRVTGSQEREDSRHYIDFFGGIWLEPSNFESAYSMGYEAFAISEKLDVPVVIRLTSQFFENTIGEYERQQAVKVNKERASKPEKFIAYPIYWKAQSDNLAHKNEAIQNYVDSLYEKRRIALDDGDTGVISVGLNKSELSHSVIEKTDILTINHYPLPYTAIQKFVSSKKKVLIFEQGDDYVSRQFTSYYGRKNLPFKLITSTGLCPDMDKTWKVWDHLEKLFYALKNVKPSFVVGDVGQYTVETTHGIDACLCLGSSVGVASGVAESGADYPFCIVGDGSFIHGCIPALYEAKRRAVGLGIIIIDNGGSMATGGQPLIANIREVIGSASIIEYELEYECVSVDNITEVLNKMKNSKQLSVVYVTIKMGA